MTPTYQEKLLRYCEADSFLDGLLEAYRILRYHNNETGRVSTKMELKIEEARNDRKAAFELLDEERSYVAHNFLNSYPQFNEK